MPALAARFEIERVKAADYGLACWEIFWRAVDPSEVTGIKFFEGDSRQTLQGAESVFCIAAWAPRDEPLARLKTSLEENEVFRRCASEPPFAQLADEELLLGDSGLVDAGQITSAGELVGDAGTGRRALGVVRRQKRHDRDEGPDNTAASRPFPASARTADLPELDSFSELLELLDRQFKPQGYTFAQAWLSPEELCDVADAYTRLIEIKWHEYSSGVSEEHLVIRFFGREPRDEYPAEFHGLFPYASDEDAVMELTRGVSSYPDYAAVVPSLAGLQGKWQLNFWYPGYSNSRDMNYEKGTAVDSNELWTRMVARGKILGIPHVVSDTGDVGTAKGEEDAERRRSWWKRGWKSRRA